MRNDVVHHKQRRQRYGWIVLDVAFAGAVAPFGARIAVIDRAELVGQLNTLRQSLRIAIHISRYPTF